MFLFLMTRLAFFSGPGSSVAVQAAAAAEAANRSAAELGLEATGKSATSGASLWSSVVIRCSVLLVNQHTLQAGVVVLEQPLSGQLLNCLADYG